MFGNVKAPSSFWQLCFVNDTSELLAQQYWRCSAMLTFLIVNLFITTDALAEKQFLAIPTLVSMSAHHPRLLINTEIVKHVHRSIKDAKLAAIEYQSIDERAHKILTEVPVQYKKGDLLEVSRLALKRIYTLGFIYQMHPDSKFAARAKEEMLSICSFPNWHPDHFLDTAEMTNALAIGYDWFYDTLNESERVKIRTAIVTLGLQPGLDAHRTKKYFWVSESNSNWCVVCYGGLLMGALAIAGDDAASTKLAGEMLPIAIDKLQQSIEHYAPDGAWVEGLGYWRYSSIYAASAIAALQTALGTDFGLSTVPGLDRAGIFLLYAVGPTGKCFDFADAEPSVRNSPQLFWLSKRYHLPVLAYEERYLLEHANDKLDVRDLIWFDPQGSIADLKALPLIAKFGGETQLATMRNAWGDRDASFLAFKGGNNASHHSHLELGTFVFDSDGCRWVQQMGVENYDLPGYFERTGTAAPRWSYYRTRTEGQNTVVVDGSNQDVTAKGLIIEDNQPAIKDVDCVALNLDQAFSSRGIEHYSRIFAVSKKQPHSVVVIDSLSGLQPFDAVWQIHTRADIALSGDKAILSFGDKKLLLKVITPDACSITVADVKLTSPQLESKGIRKLSVRAGGRGNKVRFVVLLMPFTGSEPTDFSSFAFAQDLQ